jgi:hypothetical protein
MNAIDPYIALGLRRNPFIAESHPGVPAHLWIDRGFSQAPPIRANLLLQILGEKGAGKTSHLLHWREQTPGAYCYYPPGWARWKLPTVDAIAYWDEADRIPLPLLYTALWQAARTRATIVAGTHADLSAIARQVGLQVQTLDLPVLQVETLMDWVALRIAAVQLPNTTVKLQLSPTRAAEIIAASGASWRTAAVQLHIWAAEVARSRDWEKSLLPLPQQRADH